MINGTHTHQGRYRPSLNPVLKENKGGKQNVHSHTFLIRKKENDLER